MKEKFKNHIHTLQNTITKRLEEIDGKATFKEDKWNREEGGGGITRVIENGNIFEKGGVNTSAVYGVLPKVMQDNLGVSFGNFFATGLSLVLHPNNPFIPTVHANWRYFELYDKDNNLVDQWFGGGQDLTPYYLFDEDAIHWHTICKNSCDKTNLNLYPKYKNECDKYFWNIHRKEARGVGGLFYDYLRPTQDTTLDTLFNLSSTVGNSFLEAYLPIVECRKDMAFNQSQKEWQEIRRGRYVEFNLVYDRGTLFGLKTNGRIESILMSLPPNVKFIYNHEPLPNSEEAKLVEVLKKPKNWI
ncbi:MAG: oxygen-dependent coproporphyrinogen oxidase [Solirubrobacteraceae bacterium]